MTSKKVAKTEKTKRKKEKRLEKYQTTFFDPNAEDTGEKESCNYFCKSLKNTEKLTPYSTAFRAIGHTRVSFKYTLYSKNSIENVDEILYIITNIVYWKLVCFRHMPIGHTRVSFI